MSKPSAPPPPDYAALAKTQGAANKETAITEFSMNNANQNTPWGSRSLNQNGVDAQGNPKFEINTTLNATDQANLDKTRGIQSSLLNLAPTAMNNVWSQIDHPINMSGMPPMVNQVDAGGTQKLDLSHLNASQSHVDGSPVQGALDFSNLNGLDSGDAVRNRVEQANFSKFYDRFAPAAQQQQDALQTRIANMGGVSDSEGARRMQSQLLAGQGDQFRQGVFDSIDRGGVEAQRQFGMSLQGRQQGVDEVSKQGQFYNAAQDQDFQQGMANANLNNSTRTNDANLNQMQVNTNNAANQQDVGNAFANANLTNASRAQGLSEQASLRQMPLNELNALLTGSQVQQPQFQPPTATNIAPPPIFQAGQAQWNAANQAYQGAVAGANNTMGTVGGIASAGIMAF